MPKGMGYNSGPKDTPRTGQSEPALPPAEGPAPNSLGNASTGIGFTKRGGSGESAPAGKGMRSK